MRGKQSVRKGVWYLGGKRRLKKKTKRGQKGGNNTNRLNSFCSCTICR